MAGFKPAQPFTVAFKLLTPTTTNVQGTTKKTFPDPESVEEVRFCSFRTFGGTETTSNGIYTVIDTATINCWYDPAITADCRIYLPETGKTYEIVSDPEDIEMRHQWMQFKVKKTGGKA